MSSGRVDGALYAIIDLLDRIQLEYAVGGAVAMGLNGVVRATQDLDVLVSVPAIRTQELASALDSAGFTMPGDAGSTVPVNAARIIEEWRALGFARVLWKGVPVELFIPRVPLQHEILTRRWETTLEGRRCWVTTAEDLIVLKMIFHRPKDIVDVQRLLVARQGELDLQYLSEWMERSLEAESARELAGLVAAYAEQTRRDGVESQQFPPLGPAPNGEAPGK